MRRPAALYKLEADVRDCQVDGKVPTDLNGAFYRVGPDPQYPLHPRDIPFDGEGHVSMFRIKNGRVDYKSRMVRNERWLANDKAGRAAVPDLSQSVAGRSERQRLEPQHGQHAHHQPQELPARVEGGQPALGDGLC